MTGSDIAVDSLRKAVDLFRENEAMFGDIKQDKEKANLYGGLALLAEGLAAMAEERSTD